MDLSVVMCTHNPRLDYLNETLHSLMAQTLPLDRWELLIIDNASQEPLESRCDLSWHPRARIVREENLGVMHARMRGLQEFQSDLIVYIDDDTPFCVTYLESVLRLATRYDWLGTFGASKITARYEKEPAPELEFYCGNLGLRNDNRDTFTNIPQITVACPFCAGMCIRRPVAEALIEKKRDSNGPVFGRKGTSLFSGEDLEFSLMAADLGFAYGIFAELSVTHLIPARRVQPEYLLNLHEAMIHSNDLLRRVRAREKNEPPRASVKELAMMVSWALRIAKSKGMTRRFEQRRARGLWKSLKDYRQIVRDSGNQHP